MAINFVWEDAYTVGDEEIDGQHQRMFRLANELPEVLDVPLVKRRIMDLYRHTREHFEAEEAMMKRIGYPALEEHRELHIDLVTRLNAVSSGSFESARAVCDFKKFVYDWVLDHIMCRDKEYFRFSQGQRGGR